MMRARLSVSGRGSALAHASTACLLGAVGACGDLTGREIDVDLAPVTIAAAEASNPTVALAADGTTFVAWVGGSDAYDVWLARGSAGVLGEPVRVNDIAGDAAPHGQAPAQVAVGPEGDVYVLWQNNTIVEGRRFPASDLRLARSVDGGRTFEPAIFVNDDAGGPPASHAFHDLEVAADGTVYASWIDGRAEGTAIHGDHGGGAQEARGPDIRVARSSDGGRSFGPGTLVASNACPCCRTSLAIGPDGAVYVAWRQIYEGDVRDIVVARSDDGGATFSEPVRVHEDGWVFRGCPHAGPAVAVGSDGVVHVAWYTGADGGAVFHAPSGDGGRTFGAPARLTISDFVPTAQVALVAADEGVVWVAWEAAGAQMPRLRMARVRGDERPRPLALPPATGVLPELAANGGTLALAWLDGDAVRALVGTAQAEGGP